MNAYRQHVFDKPGNVRRLLRMLYLACALLISADFFYHRHVASEWEAVWGFYGLFGFVACVTLVLVAGLLRKILMRPEDYYGN